MKKLLFKGFYQLRILVSLACVLLFLVSITLIAFLPSGTVYAHSTHTFTILDTTTPTTTPTTAPTNTPTPTPTKAPTNTPTPTPTKAPTPTPTKAPTPTPTPTQAPAPIPTDTPTPAPTIPPVIIITAVPTINVPNVSVSPTSQAVIPAGQQPTPLSNGSSTPTPSPSPSPSAHGTAPASPYPTNAGNTPDDSATSPSISHTNSQKSSLSSMLLPIAAIAGMVGIAAAALIAIEMRKRQRLLLQQPANTSGTSASPSQQAGQGNFSPYTMQPNPSFVGAPSVSGPPAMAPFYNQAEAHYNQNNSYNDQGNYDQNATYNQEGYEQEAHDTLPPAMRAAMGNNPPASSSAPPPWMQTLSANEDPEENYQTLISNTPANQQAQTPPAFHTPFEQSSFSTEMQPSNSNPLFQQPDSLVPLSPSGFAPQKLPESGPSSQADPFLEAIMRQAQMGIFALPDKGNEEI